MEYLHFIKKQEENGVKYAENNECIKDYVDFQEFKRNYCNPTTNLEDAYNRYTTYKEIINPPKMPTPTPQLSPTPIPQLSPIPATPPPTITPISTPTTQTFLENIFRPYEMINEISTATTFEQILPSSSTITTPLAELPNIIPPISKHRVPPYRHYSNRDNRYRRREYPDIQYRRNN